MIVGDLFSGIGGFSLAAEWMGWRTAWFSEIDPFASRVLAHHWPDVPNFGDIRAIDWATVEPVDVLTGGFPCQPHSLAGKRQGSNDERDLFDEIIRCAGVLRPRYIVLENVPGLFTSDAGRFFGRVLGALASLGYDAEWRVLSAADVGAPHRRERVWIVAHADGGRREQRDASTGRQAAAGTGHVYVGHSQQPRLEGRSRHEGSDVCGRNDSATIGSAAEAGVSVGWSDAAAVQGHDGTVRLIPHEAAQEGPESSLWPVADGVPGRVARLRGIGNSIVPQCALEIFSSIDGRHTDTVTA